MRAMEALMKLKVDAKEAQKFYNTMDKMHQSFMALKAEVASVSALVNELTSYTDKYVTSQKVLNQTFGDGVVQVNKYSKSLAYMTGISETSISSTLSLFGQMSTSLGMTTDSANEFSIALADMSAKLAMLYNIDFEQASKSLLDAVKGESSTLTTLTGIVIKNQTLQNTLTSLGINQEASELTGVNLAMLQYITIANQLNVTNKEMQETVNGVAFQKQILANQIKNLYNAFGNLLYPILEKILPLLNAVLIVITNIVNVFARLLGYNGSLFETTNKNATAFTNFGNSVKKSSDSVSKSLRGFDKLNNMTTPSTDTASSSNIGIDPNLYNEFQKVSQEMLDINNKAQEIANSIMEWFGFTQDANGEWEFSKVTLGTVLGVLIGGGGLIWAISKIVNLFKTFKNLKTGGLAGLIMGSSGATSTSISVPNVKTILTAIADITLIIGAVTLLVEAIGLLTKIPGFTETASSGIKQLQDIFTGLGQILVPLGVFTAGIALLGLASPVTILSGLAGFTLVIVGFEAVLLAIGGLRQIPGFDWLINEGGIALMNLANILGGVAGSLVAGFADKATEGLGDIGNNLSSFMNNAKPFFEGVSGINESSMNGVKILADTILTLTASNILDGLFGWATGKESLEKFGEMLPGFGKNMKKYADNTKGIDGNAVTASANSAKSLAELANNLPNKGGLVSWFTGDNTLDDFGEMLPGFGEDLAKYANYIKDINPDTVSASANSAKALKELADNLPNQGGIVSWFTGDNTLADFGENVKDFGSYFKEYYDYISTINTAKVDSITNSIKSLIDISNNIKNNGISSTIYEFASNLSSASSAFNNFFSKTNASSIGSSFGSSLGSAIAKALRNTTYPTIKLTSTSNKSTLGSFKISAKAEGGFVDYGEMFVARENGIPEFVGSIGNRTAVANNDQIVEAVSAGVAKAILATQNNKKQQPIYVKAQFGDEEVTDWLQVKQNQKDRQYGF